MRQPRFKFGERVMHEGKWFEVGAISFNEARQSYFYNSEAQIYNWMEEDSLDLYLVTRKEKLFAFKSTRTGSVIYRDHQWGENQFYRRFPDGDKVIQ